MFFSVYVVISSSCKICIFLYLMVNLTGCVTVLPSPALSHTLILLGRDRKCLPESQCEQPVSAEHKYAVFRGTHLFTKHSNNVLYVTIPCRYVAITGLIHSKELFYPPAQWQVHPKIDL